MAEEKKLTREDFSAVWKDGGNVRGGLKLDLVNHLKQQREVPAWLALKERMMEKIIENLPTDRPVQVLEIGCGLGIDIFELAKRIAQANSSPGSRIIGLDFNSEMVAYCSETLEEARLAGSLPPSTHVAIEFLREDATVMSSVGDDTFDLVRSDIALQHMDIVSTLTQIGRILKSGGRYLSLEGAAGAGFFSSDDYVTSTYRKILPSLADGGPGVRAFFELKKSQFQVISYEYHGIAQRGKDLQAADPGWVKLQGAGKMVVERGVMTQEQSDEYICRFKKVVEDDQVLVMGGCTLAVAQKA